MQGAAPKRRGKRTLKTKADDSWIRKERANTDDDAEVVAVEVVEGVGSLALQLILRGCHAQVFPRMPRWCHAPSFSDSR